ncbi:MAG: YbjN domain-containing protein [Pseudomonadota bacterium]
MTSLLADDAAIISHNPLDLVEDLINSFEWPYERTSDDEITAAAKGTWCEYHIRAFWREDDAILQVASVFDMRVPEAKRAALCETLALVNERLWLGHFELWAEDGAVLFRHATFIDSGAGLSQAHAEMLLQTAVSECERFYPVFQFVLWAGKKPAEAVEAAMLETVGEA